MNRKKFIQTIGSLTVGLIINGCGNDNKTKSNNNLSKIDKSKTNRKKSLEPIFINKGDKEYDKCRELYNKNLDNFPNHIAKCKTENEISEVVKYAKKTNQKISIKSGGHSFLGTSVGTNTICINLSEMKNIEWVNDNLIKIQAGCQLSQIYKEIIPKGKIIPGGSCGSVGIGGLTLGGGYGFFSRMYGLTCDNLVDVTLIDGNGIITKSNKDILWACKGGNNGHLGIVADLTFKLNPAPTQFTELNFTLNSNNQEKIILLFYKYLEITKALPKNTFSSFFISSKNSSIRLVILGYYEYEEIKRSILEIADNCIIDKSNNLLKSIQKRDGSPKPLYFNNASCGYFNDSQEIRNAVYNSIPIILKSKELIYQVNSLGGAINEIGINDSAYPHRNYNYLSELQSYWNSNTKNIQNIYNNFNIIQNNHYEQGINSHYANYPSLGFKNFNESYYAGNLNKLKSLKNIFDPQNLFYNQQGLE